MEQQICGDNESKTTQTECPKLSIFVDHTGFLSIERGLKIRDFKWVYGLFQRHGAKG